MYARARDRRHVHHRALYSLELVYEAAGEHDRSEEVDLEHVVPDVNGRVERPEPLATVGLWRDCSVIDQRVQFMALDPSPDLLDRRDRVGFVGKINLDVILGPGFPRAIFRKWMPRTRNDAPPRSREAFDRRVTDTAACSGEEQRAARLGRLRTGHVVSGMGLACDRQVDASSRIEPRLGPGVVRMIAFELDAIVETECSLLPELDRDRHDSIAGPVGGPRDVADGVLRGIGGDRLP